MAFQHIQFPPIPEDTARAAGSLFGKGNIYIKIGEQLNELISSLTPLDLEILGDRSANANTLYAMMTIIQVAEQLTDRQMVEAVRSRVDLKYALHLPLNYLSFDPIVLSEFRKQLSKDAQCQKTFQTLLDRITILGLLGNKAGEALQVSSVLDLACTSLRIELVEETMNEALEALAVINAEWLRKVALPQWYARYSRREPVSYWPNDMGQWKHRVLEIAADIQYLLKEVDNSQISELTSLKEIKSLRQEWEEQFTVNVDGKDTFKFLLLQ
jgi:hypothetical protein